jgi:voltage-gated potassium channel Kch
MRLLKKYRRQVIFIIVLLTAWLAFLSTPMPGEEMPVRIFKAMYFAATLFIFGALDIGFPESESAFLLVVLWTCYFIAPAFTISYVYKIIEERLFNKLPFKLKNHSIIMGMGRTGLFIYQMIKDDYPNDKIVVVDRNLQNPNIPVLEQARYVWWVRNDFEQEMVLHEAKVKTARRIFITTNNDLTNLKAAFKCLKMNPGIENIYCHLQNYAMHEDFAESLKQIRKYDKITVFNAYTSAAQEILQLINERDEEKRERGRIFVFMGFGHFGLTLFDDLVTDDHTSKSDEIIVVTLKNKLLFDIVNYPWADKKANKCKVHQPVYKDIFFAETWNEIEHLVKSKNKSLIMINCLDNGEGNISLALQIKKNGPETLKNAVIYCRTFKPVSEELENILEHNITRTEGRDIIPFSIEEALHPAYRKIISEP